MRAEQNNTRIALITMVTRRPGPGFDQPISTAILPLQREISPELCANLYRDALNHVNNYIRPPESAPDLGDGLFRVQEAAQAYVLREGKLNDAQADELAYQLEVLRALHLDLPYHWKELIAVPGLRFLQSIGSLADYEYGLVYLALCCLDREHDPVRTQEELRGLVQSWNLTMEPGEGRFSLSMLLMAIRGTAWWSQLSGLAGGFHRPVKLAMLGAIDGAVCSASGQKLEGHRDVDWNLASMGLLQGALSYSVAAIPAVERWKERMLRRLETD